MNFYISDDLKYHKNLPADADTADIGWCDAEKVDSEFGEYEKCPLCGRPVSMRRWMEPRKIKLSNSRFPDRIGWWILDPLIVSEKVKEGFEHEHMIGIDEFIPVEVVKISQKGKKALPPPLYFAAEVSYNESVRVDYKNTIIIGQPYDWKCELCNPFGTTCEKVEQLRLDTHKWNGTDVLRVYSVGLVYSERFYNFIKEHNFTNFNLVRVEEYQT